MEYPKPLANLIKQAGTLDSKVKERTFRLFANIITPEEQIPLIIPTGFARLSAFGLNHADDCQIKGQLQPGVYLDRVLKFKDNLFIEVIERTGLNQTLKRYRAIPLGDNNPSVTGGSTGLANIGSKDSMNMTPVTFQLIDPGYATLKNQMTSGVFLMTKLDTVLLDQFAKFGEELTLEEQDSWKGVDLVRPIDNDKVFKHVVIPSGIPLVKLPAWLQQHEEFGIYSTGIGSFYRSGYWYVYPLFRFGLYERAKRVLHVVRLPEDIFPTLKRTHFEEGRVLTIMSSGGGKVKDGRDVAKQNRGVGKRIISADAVTGDSGYYYSKGQAIATREDSVSEVSTSSRGSGEEMVPFLETPTNNLCKHLSQNAYNEGMELNIRWDNSDGLLIVPGMPLRYYYLVDNELRYREGTVLSIRSEYMKDTKTTQPVFREFSMLTLFVDKDERS